MNFNMGEYEMRSDRPGGNNVSQCVHLCNSSEGQREAAKAGQNLEGEAFAQMCLDYLSAPATSVDAERLFSFSGGTVSKLCNQLSEHSAHAAVMVGQWADLIAAKEFEAQLVEGWLRKKKRKADIPAKGQSAPKVVVIAVD
ncbi:hypothetical protein B0H13DRAFT_1898521 [Mycena leptocephala]|nr:hypothetical protein B0H13DRAFT_1898521 [Mycena leptocephala]